jgi:hypothetical protein
MKMTRAQTASRIRDVRYAVRSGACVVAGNFLREVVAYSDLRDRTVKNLVKLVNRCKTAPHFRRRRRRPRG